MARSDLILRIGADDSALQKSLKRLNNSMVSFGRRLENVGQDLSLKFTAPLVLAGAASVKTFAQFDKLEKGLTAITGSLPEAQKQFGTLLDIVKDTRTTLDLKTAATASLQLQAVGRDARSVENTLRQLSIAATLAGSSSDDVGEVARQLSQAAAKGNILQQELRIILERIPSLAAVIKNEFGTVTAEGLRDAGVSADDFINRLTGAIEANEKFQSVQGGLSKSIETFGVNLQIAGAELGKTIAKTIGLENALDTVSNVISTLVEGFSELSPTTKTIILGFAGITAAIGPLAFGIGALAKTLPLLRAGIAALTGPVGIIVTLIGAAAAAFLVYKARTTAAAQAQRELSSVQNEGAKAIAREKSQVKQLVSVLKDETSSKAQRASAIKNLQSLSKEYFGNLDAEKSKIEDITAASDKYTESLLKQARIQAARNRLVEIEEQLLDVQSQTQNAKPTFVQSLTNALTSAGNAGVFAAKQVKGFSANLEDNKSRLEASRDALLDFIKSSDGIASVSTGSSTSGSTGGSGGGGQRRKLVGLTPEIDPGQLSSLPSFIAEFEKVAQNSSIAQTNQDFEAFAKNISTAVNPLTSLGQSFEEINEKSFVFGENFNVLEEKLTAVREAITTALDEGFSPTSTVVETLTEQFSALTDQVERQKAAMEATAAVAGVYKSAFEDASSSQIDGFRGVARAALDSAKNVVKAKLMEATAAYFADSFAKFGLFGAILAAGAGAVVGGLFSATIGKLNIPALAEGAIATGPTLALIGEGRESEAILPLSKLNTLIQGGGGGNQELVARVDGEDLFFLLRRVEKTLNRVG